MGLTSTHTFAELEVSAATYDEIAGKLRDAGYDHAFTEEGAIDMHGIGLVKGDAGDKVTVPRVPTTEMIDAWRQSQAQGHSLQTSYCRMIAAAPAAPTS